MPRIVDEPSKPTYADFTPAEKRITAQLDLIGAIALTISRRLGWAVFLLSILAGGCVLDFLRR